VIVRQDARPGLSHEGSQDKIERFDVFGLIPRPNGWTRLQAGLGSAGLQRPIKLIVNFEYSQRILR
jgi:hypothetical protein